MSPRKTIAKRIPFQSRNSSNTCGSSSASNSNAKMSSSSSSIMSSTLESSNSDINKRINSSVASSAFRRANSISAAKDPSGRIASASTAKQSSSTAPKHRSTSTTSPPRGTMLARAASSSSRSGGGSGGADNVLIEEKRRHVSGQGYTTHKYLRGRIIGKGGFAKVYVCTAMDTNKQYAVKVVPKANLVKARARQKLQAEIKIHRTLKHHHVCEYKHFFEDRENCYILLELCHNQSMNELLKRRKRLTEPEAGYFMKQMIQAVEYMHEQNVIHRDLKLGNLFLDKHLHIKVGDLGLATRLQTAEEKRQTICGTPNYIAPEVIQGTRETRGHSFEVDVWSMGVILFTLLVGKPPYEAKDVKATYQRIISNQYQFPNHVEISEYAKDLIATMLQSKPIDRPSLEEICMHPFFMSERAMIPEAIPIKSLHSAPEWRRNELGQVVAVTKDDENQLQKKSSHPTLPRSSSSSKRQPLAIRDPNATEQKAAAQNKAATRTGMFPRTAPDRVATSASSSGSSARSSQPAFEIYDESEASKKTPASVPKAASSEPNSAPSMGDLVKGAAALSLFERQGEATPSPDIKAQETPARPTHETETKILLQMLERLTTLLDVSESRKNTYLSARPQATSRGSPKCWVTRYVDYTSKYGLGFLLNDGSSGVYFNDSTKAVLEAEGDNFQYVERKKVDPPATADNTAGVRPESVIEHYTLSDHPESLQKKVTLLKHFRNYLIEQQKKAEDDGSFEAASGASGEMVFLKKWVRTKHAILFRLSNQTVQIVFYDQTEVLLTPDERFVTYVDKKRTRTTFYLNDELVASNAELAKRLKYSKEILHQLLAGQQQRAK